MGTVIIGAGISGLMAASLFPRAVVLERGTQETIMPMLNATFYAHERVPKFAEREVLVRTRVVGGGTAEDYAEKIYGDRAHPVSMSRIVHEIKAWEWNNKALLNAAQGRVVWNVEVQRVDLEARRVYVSDHDYLGKGFFSFSLLISSVPLPVMLKMTGQQVAGFKSEPIWLDLRNIPYYPDHVPPDGEQWVTYYPDPLVPYYRSNQMGGSTLVEYEYSDKLAPPDIKQAGRALRPGKIWPHPDAERLVKQLRDSGVVCVGRYACWKPKMLSHHTWQLLQLVTRWI